MNQPWYEVEDVANLESPSLLLYRDRVKSNIDLMVAMAGGDTTRLRPHVKTHKMAEVVRWQMERGLRKFKCATIAEAEMLGGAGVDHVLLAYPMIGPNIHRFIRLNQQFPATQFACVVDHSSALMGLANAAVIADHCIEVFLDIDCGMHRTGHIPNREALELYRLISQTIGIKLAGLHVYDGHIHQPNPADREAACIEAFQPVWKWVEDIRAANLPIPNIVVGGTPTYPIHIRDSRLECSPGTPLLWDFGYGDKFVDLPFIPAALVLARVLSCPFPGIVCTDLGYKAVASEGPIPRVKFLNLPEAEHLMHSEEHLVLKVPVGSEPAVGSVLYGVPRHICPTVALYGSAVLIEGGKVCDQVEVTSRNRHLTI